MTLAILDTIEHTDSKTSRISKENQDKLVQEQIENLLRATEQEIKKALTTTREESMINLLLRAFLEKPAVIRGEIQKEIEKQTRKTGDVVCMCLKKIDTPPGTPPEMDNGHWQYRFKELRGKEHLLIDSIFGPYGGADKDELRLFSDRVQVRKLNRIPERLIGMHQKMLEIEKEIESHDLRYVLRGVANQFLGIGVAKLAKTISVSEQDIQRHIEKLNQEVLAEHDLKIHVRNGIAIIGGTDEAEPIFVINSPESRKKFSSQDEDATILFSGSTDENTDMTNKEPPKPRPPSETLMEIKGNEYQLTTTERLKDAAMEIAEFLARRKFPLNSIPGKPLQLHLEIAEKNGKIIIKSNIRIFASNCRIYEGRMVIALSKVLNVETVVVQLINF